MATDGPTPPPCRDELMKRGTLVFQTRAIGEAIAIERWVQKVAALCGQPVDWYFCGLYTMVVATGNLERVKAALRALMPEHDAMFFAGMDERDRAYYKPPRPAWWSRNDAVEVDTVPRVVTAADGSMMILDPQASAIIATVAMYNAKQRRSHTRECTRRAARGVASASDKAWLRAVGAGTYWTTMGGAT